MIHPVNNKIIVSCDLKQKDEMVIDGVTMKMATLFEKNYREKSPVIAKVVEGNEWVKEGDILLCHHNTFYQPSPYYLYDNLFSIPASNIIFAVLQKDGSLNPVYGNLICERVPVEKDMPVSRETEINRSVVLNGGYSKYKKGQLIFHRPHAGYDIVYIWDGIENRVTKVHEDQICGIFTGNN
jgi:hypothetical protein